VETDLNPAFGEFADAVRSLTAVASPMPNAATSPMSRRSWRAEARYVTGGTWNLHGGYAL
jgi:hypothetical protein